jgi:PLP dependent protein
MARLITGLTAERVARNLAEVRAEIAQAGQRSGRDASAVQICAAVKYVPLEEIGVLAEAGVELAGENRAQDLGQKAAAQPELTWDFIGHLQSRKVKQVLPHVRLIHSVASDSVLAQLEKHAAPGTRVLVEVNVGGEDSKSGVEPEELGAFIARCPVEVAGLMTMPPLAGSPEESRPYFAALRELAAVHGLQELSMGTTQDFPIAVEEGATIVRIGTRLYG